MIYNVEMNSHYKGCLVTFWTILVGLFLWWRQQILHYCHGYMSSVWGFIIQCHGSKTSEIKLHPCVNVDNTMLVKDFKNIFSHIYKFNTFVSNYTKPNRYLMTYNMVSNIIMISKYLTYQNKLIYQKSDNNYFYW